MKLSEQADAIHAEYPNNHRSVSGDAVIRDGRMINGFSWAQTGTAMTASESTYVALPEVGKYMRFPLAGKNVLWYLRSTTILIGVHEDKGGVTRDAEGQGTST